MFNFIIFSLFLLFSQLSFASGTPLNGLRWQYRWTESEPWRDIASPCSPFGRENRELLFLKLIKSDSSGTHLLIRDQSFSFELVDDSNRVTKFPADRTGYLAGYEDFIVDVGDRSEIYLRSISDAKNYIGFCKGIFLGSEESLRVKLINESFIPFISALVCLFLSVILLILSRIESTLHGFFASSLTAFLLGTWTFALPNNNLKEFLFADSAVWLWIDQMSIMFFPYALCGILEFLTDRSLLRITKFMKYVHLVFAFVSAVAVGIGLVKFHQTNFVFNLIVPFTIILIFVEIARNVKRSKHEIVALLIGILCITIFGINDLFVGLWILPQNPLMLPLGFVGFSIAVTYSSVAWMRQKNALTKKLALESAQLSASVETIQTVAHDVRRPFSLIRMLVDTLQGTDNALEQKQLLTIARPEIEQAVNSADALIQDMLELGKPIELQICSASLTAVVEKSLLLVGLVAKEKESILRISFNHTHQVQIDAGRIERVVVNILQNAIEAMPQRAQLFVRTTEVGSRLTLYLRNFGSFIDGRDLPRIFDKFHTSGKANGTGLGLHISKQFVEAHGGVIKCLSERGDSAKDSFVEFQITFSPSDMPDRFKISQQLDRYFSFVDS